MSCFSDVFFNLYWILFKICSILISIEYLSHLISCSLIYWSTLYSICITVTFNCDIFWNAHICWYIFFKNSFCLFLCHKLTVASVSCVHCSAICYSSIDTVHACCTMSYIVCYSSILISLFCIACQIHLLQIENYQNILFKSLMYSFTSLVICVACRCCFLNICKNYSVFFFAQWWIWQLFSKQWV